MMEINYKVISILGYSSLLFDLWIKTSHVLDLLYMSREYVMCIYGSWIKISSSIKLEIDWIPIIYKNYP